MKRFNIEITVGLFVVLGLCALGYVSIKLGQLPIGGSSTYQVTAQFSNVTGLQRGATIEIAGVRVGRVEHIKLMDDYDAVVTLRLDSKIQLQDDAMVSIKTQGLIGEKYIRITPGASDQLITAGDRIRDVENPIDFEELIGQFIQGKL